MTREQEVAEVGLVGRTCGVCKRHIVGGGCKTKRFSLNEWELKHINHQLSINNEDDACLWFKVNPKARSPKAGAKGYTYP